MGWLPARRVRDELLAPLAGGSARLALALVDDTSDAGRATTTAVFAAGYAYALEVYAAAKAVAASASYPGFASAVY